MKGVSAALLRGIPIVGSPTDGQALLYDAGGRVLSWATPAGGGSAFVWRGTWSAGAAYVANDVVAYNGTSYIATASNTNNSPPSAVWSTMAQKGDTGATGAAGPAPSGTGLVYVASGTPEAVTIGSGLSLTGAAGSRTISAPGGAATTLLDLDFTAQTPETISADTTRSWGGVTWTIDGNSWASQSLIVDANGVAATNAATSKVMIIHALLSDIGGLLSSDNFRLWLYATESAAVAAGANATVPTIDLGVRQWDGSQYLTPIITAKLNGYGAAGGVSVQGFDGFTDNTAATNAAWASLNVIAFERRAGVYRASFGAYSGGFPSYASLRSFIERPQAINGQNTGGAGWLESQTRLYIDLRNNASTTQTLTLKRLLVQKLP